MNRCGVRGSSHFTQGDADLHDGRRSVLSSHLKEIMNRLREQSKRGSEKQEESGKKEVGGKERRKRKSEAGKQEEGKKNKAKRKTEGERKENLRVKRHQEMVMQP